MKLIGELFWNYLGIFAGTRHARAYFINGQIKEAIDAENKALKLEPYNDEFKGKLREYEKAMGTEETM